MRLSKPVTIEDRLGALPRDGLPLKARLAVHWDEHQIPFIEAESDSDLAVALGVVHLHLRWGQMEIMRRVAQGRLAEMIGPPGVPIDHALRALALPRIASSIASTLPEETAQWLDAFVAGINHAVERAPRRPPEFRILGIARERWRVEDVLALGRLAAADVTWLRLLPLLQERDTALASEVWRRGVGAGTAGEGAASASLRARTALAFAPSLAWAGGSNSLAVAPSRSFSGGALIASDPHLPVMVPNPFLVAGYKSPSFHVVGLMIPGLPFVVMGRNARIAWGGTNLHAASSELFDISDLPPDAITQRRERIRVRWWRDRTVTIRECEWGPVVSDLAILRRARRGHFALRWVGFMPSDEVTTMLRVNRARDWSEFRAALDSLAVPGQNLIYADVEGHIGKAMAARLPARPLAPPVEAILPRAAADAWRSFVTARDLPAIFDPAEGFVVSANERPSGTPVPVGYLFSSRSRRERLEGLLGSGPIRSLGDLAALQQDVFVPWAATLRDDLVRSLRALADARGGSARRLVRALQDWDGHYDAESRGALCFELFVFHLMEALGGRRRLALYAASWNGWDFVRTDIAAAQPQALAAAARKAAAAASRVLGKRRVWGDFHRLRLPHAAGALPLIGRRFRFGDWPVAGSDETVLKTPHELAGGRHHVRLAPSARHVSDLADPDRNYFVLLGGQDGWLGSATMLDQVKLWQTGDSIQVPLSIDTMRRTFRFRTELSP